MTGRDKEQESGGAPRSPAREAQRAALLQGGISEELLVDAERALSPDCPDLAERLWRDQKVSEEKLCATLSAAAGAPRVEQLTPPASAVALLPISRWHTHRALPISWENDHLQVALLNPFDQEFAALLKSISTARVSFAVAPPSELLTCLEALAGEGTRQETGSTQREGVKDFQAFLAWLPRPVRGER